VRYARHSRPTNWRFDRDERQLRGGPIVDALKQRWREEMRPD